MKKIISVFIVIVLMGMLILPNISIATDLISITFPDENLYNEITKELEDKIESKNDDTQTIQMTQENIDVVKKLNLYGKEIKNISGLDVFKNLTELDLSENNIQDITELKELKNLTGLGLAQNNISDITALKELKDLIELYLSENNIQDITLLKDLKNLKLLELSKNNVKDITELKELKNLMGLGLAQNNVSDITALKQLKNLMELYLPENNIQDITPLKDLTNLEYLYLNENNITDISALDNLNKLKEVNLENQKIILNVNKEIKLPSIFFQSQDANSKGYSGGSLNFENCKLNEDGETLNIDNEEEKAKVTIEGEKGLYGSVLEVTVDKQVPKVTLEYSTTKPTKENVIVKIKADEEIQEVEGWTLSEDRKTLEKEYSQNKEEDVVVKDLAGNETKITVKVENIIKDEENNKEENNKPSNTEKTPPTSLPYVGKITLTFIIILSGIILVILFIQYRKYRKIK